MKEEVRAVSEQWYCNKLISGQRPDLMNKSGYGWWDGNCSNKKKLQYLSFCSNKPQDCKVIKMWFSSKLNTASITATYFNTRKQQFPFKVFNQVLPDDKAPYTGTQSC
jgi:hypothetical protein